MGARVVFFLSYAKEDGETARDIADRLADRGISVFRWQDPHNRGGRFIQRIEDAIRDAGGFIALLSPSFLASTWCRLERELAIQREADLRAGGRDTAFIHVLKILDTPYHDAGFLRSYDWLDLTDPARKEAALTDLVRRLAGARQSGPPSPDGAITSRGSPLFRNRYDELEQVRRGLTNAAGPHFWLVLAPPQLGKTWFLDRISAEMLAGPSGWAARLVDLREQPGRDPR